MRRNLLAVLICFFVLGQAKGQVLLTEGFEGTAFPPVGWTRINAGSAQDWQSSDYANFEDGPYSSFAHGGSKAMVCEYDASSPSDAWMITPSIAVTSGSVYSVTFWYVVRSSFYLEKLKVTVGNAATVAAQSTILWSNNGGASLSNTTYASTTVTYTATSSGNVFFGFNCFSDANQWAMIVDDIQIEKLSSCGSTPVAGTASGPAQACPSARVSLSVTGNTAVLGGISYKWQTTSVGGSSWVDVPGATSTTASVTVPTGGADYRFVVTCSNAGSPANSNVVSVASQTTGCPPINDDYCGAIALTINGPTECSNTTTATSVNDPVFSNSTPNNTLWYKYTPTVTGPATIVFSRPNGVTTGLLDGWLGIYTATGICPSLSLSEVMGNTLDFDLTSSATITLATTALTAGTTYYFMIDGYSAAYGGFCMQVITTPTPPVSCATGLVPANNATGVSYPAATLSWNAVAAATSYDVYFGTVNPPTTPGNVATTSISATGLAASTTYYWYVVPKNAGGSVAGCNTPVYSFTTAATPPPPPINDDCSGAVAILGWGTVAGSSISSTQSLAPILCNTFTSSGAGDVWYKFTTQNSGAATIIVTGYDVVIEAFSGTCGSLASIGCADVSGTVETLNLTGLAAATTYYFRVYGFGSVAAAQATFTVKMEGGALPVSIVNFKGEKFNGNNLLSWTTATETNNAGFELQRSADGINFSSMAYFASKANNGSSNAPISYTYTDSKSLNAGLYYRLNQIDKDGKNSLSNVVFIKGTKATKLELASIYPNPAIDKVTVLVASPKADNITFIVSDLAGKAIMSQKATVINGDNNIQLNVSSLAKGTYTIKVVCADGCETAVSRFIKQ